MKNSETIETGKSHIIIPSFKLGNHSYPDIEASLTRVSSAQYPRLEDTGTDLNGNGYIGYILFEQAIKLNQELSGFTPSIPIGRQFLKTLKAGIDGEDVFFADGSKVSDTRILKAALEDITKTSDPWRAEFLDARFSRLNDQTRTIIKYPIFGSSGEKLAYIAEELDKDTLMQLKSINFNSWLNDDNVTSQSLPKSDIGAGKYNYWPPSNGSVAGFGAVQDRSGFSCYGHVDDSFPALGVRNMRLRTKKN